MPDPIEVCSEEAGTGIKIAAYDILRIPHHGNRLLMSDLLAYLVRCQISQSYISRCNTCFATHYFSASASNTR